MVEDRKIVNSKTLTFFPDITHTHTHTHTHTENVIPKSRKPSGARQKQKSIILKISCIIYILIH